MDGPDKTKSLLSQVVLVMTLVLLLSVGLLYIPTFFKFQLILQENHKNKLNYMALRLRGRIKRDFPQKPLDKIPLEEICQEEKLGEIGVMILEKKSQQILSFSLSPKEIHDLFAGLPSQSAQVFSCGGSQALWLPLEENRQLLISLPDPAIREFQSYFFYLALLMIGSLFVGGGVMIFALYRIVLKPLEDLIVANLGTLEGKPEYLLIPPSSIPNNEIGETMRHRNRLILKLKEFQQKIEEQNEELRTSQRELENWSRELEARVEAKTRELKAAEEHLIRAEKQAALGKLASGVAHEVNNPLASIAGYAEDMIETLKAKSQYTGEEVQEFIESLGIIEDQAYRLKDLTRKLLNFARQTEIHLDEVDLHQLIHETISLVALKHRKKIPIATELDSRVVPFRTDRSKLQQVLMNLIDNGVDAIQKGGEIQVVTRSGDRGVQLIVRDTGEGIPDGIQGRIFDPFFTTKPVGSGTGLGLSICYGIIKKLKGTIEFDSRQGKGSSFVITLPLQDGGAKASGGKHQASPSGAA